MSLRRYTHPRRSTRLHLLEGPVEYTLDERVLIPRQFTAALRIEATPVESVTTAAPVRPAAGAAVTHHDIEAVLATLTDRVQAEADRMDAISLYTLVGIAIAYGRGA